MSQIEAIEAVACVTGHPGEPHVWVLRNKPIGKVACAETGHHDIAKDKIYVPLLECLANVARLNDFVLLALQCARHDRPYHLLIVHYHHPVTPCRSVRGGVRRMSRWSRSNDRRQEHGECGAFSQGALGPDVAVALTHNAMHRGKAEPGTLTHILGGEEWRSCVRSASTHMGLGRSSTIISTLGPISRCKSERASSMAALRSSVSSTNTC